MEGLLGQIRKVPGRGSGRDMSKEIQVSVRQEGVIPVIDIGGDVTATTGGAIEEAYRNVSATGSLKILLLFSKESYINSGGIAILIGIVSEGRKREQEIRMAGLSDHFQKIFHMVGITKYSRIFSSEEMAIRDF